MNHVMELLTLHLFAGAGGGILGDLLLGHRPIGAVEIEGYPRKVLLARQLDGCLPRFPIWDDVCTFRADNPDCASFIERCRQVRDRLCICGGFPCQDISAAGKGAGIEGERSGLWKEYARVVCEIRPAYVFVENSPMLTIRGLGTVLADLAAMGYDARWGILSAGQCGACHLRERIFIIADSNCQRISERGANKTTSQASRFKHIGIRGSGIIGTGNIDAGTNDCMDTNANKIRLQGGGEEQAGFGVQTLAAAEIWRNLSSPIACGGNDDVAFRVDRLKAIGNGQVPAVVELAWETLT